MQVRSCRYVLLASHPFMVGGACRHPGGRSGRAAARAGWPPTVGRRPGELAGLAIQRNRPPPHAVSAKKASATAIAAWVVKRRSVTRYSTPVKAGARTGDRFAVALADHRVLVAFAKSRSAHRTTRCRPSSRPCWSESARSCARSGSARRRQAPVTSGSAASHPPEPAPALRPLAVLRSWFRAPVPDDRCPLDRSFRHQTTRYCSGQQPTGPGFVLR
jgi:hypothetical protein